MTTLGKNEERVEGSRPSNLFDFIDYFVNDVQVNVIPVISAKKQPIEKWTQWETKTVPKEIFEEWKKDGRFDGGYGIFTGRLWQGPYQGKCLVCIDIDNRKGIEMFLSYFTEFKNIEDVAQRTLVVQHEDAIDEKAHIYFITEKPITKRSAANLIGKNTHNVPIIEVKSESSGIMVGPGCIHKDGYHYTIIGTREIKVLNGEQSDKLESVLHTIYQKYTYQSDGDKNIHNKSNLPDELKFVAQNLDINSAASYVIKIGTRDSTLLSFANSLLSRHYNSKKTTILKKFFFEVNEKLCEEPLSHSQLEKIWRQSTKYILVTNNSKEIDTANKAEEEKKTKPKIEYIAYKYTLLSQIYESVLIRGVPYFISIIEGEVQLVDKIEQDSRILRPPYAEEYSYPSHSFENKNEIIKFVKMITEQNISIDSLFFKIRNYVTKFVVHEDYVLDYISSLILFSYFQDKSATVPYTMFVGDNESGKSSIGDTLEVLAYRNINMTDPTTANLFRIFGTIEPGQCTLVLDESEKIDEDKDMLSILKTGYQYDKRVQRINQFGKQEHFHTYGLKIMLAERTPVLSKAKGVLERTFVISTFNGKPELEVKNIKNPQGVSHKAIFSELQFLRKTLLIYRLLNFANKDVEITSSLEGRNKELCNPILKLFYATHSLSKIEYALGRLLNEKSNRKASSLDRELLEVIVDLFDYYYEGKIPFGKIWSNLAERLGGTFNDARPQEMSTDVHGLLYKQTISKTLRDRFGATDPIVRTANERSLQFNIEKIKQYLQEYRKNQKLSIKCQPVICDSNDSNDSSDSSKDLFSNFFKISANNKRITTEASMVTNDGHLDESVINKPFKIKENLGMEKTRSNELTSAVITVTPVTHTFSDKNYFTNSNKDNHKDSHLNLYRKWKGGDMWACQNCKLTGDKWFMRNHLCRSNIK